ncbi:MAG: hypothetical protein J5777_06835 [Clostridiales bacterium]|nr:hypothetical protein [Clostridiales bacterium]
MLKLFIITAIIGHVLCAVCDCKLCYGPKGRLDLKCVKTPEMMKREFSGMPLANPLFSIVMGTFSIMMFAFGYLGVSNWMYGHSKLCGTIMLISSVVFIVPIVVHHVICGFVEWFYIKMERTVMARDAVLTFQKQTSATMIIGYFGLFAFAMTLLMGIATKQTSLPWWACFFNTLPIFLVMLPTKIPAKGNIAGVIMFTALLIFLW